MKFLKIGMVLCVLFVLLPFKSVAQSTMKIDIEVFVADEDGNPVTGAVAISEQDNVTGITDISGTFRMEVTPDTEIRVNAVGFMTSIVVANVDLREIALIPDYMAEVQIAYRKVARRDVPTDVSVVNVADLLEKNYFTYSLDGMEAFVGGFHGNIWGMDSYLILVDGVPREAGNVRPTEIDHISFLKGVSAVALYGSRAAKGVVLITTKRGEASAQRINVRANTGIHLPKSYPKYLGSAEYMTLYNEARANDGLSALYNDESIYHHAAGKNPYRYPNVDFYSSEFLKSAYNRTDVTAEVVGGTENARYYTNFGFENNGSLLDFGEAIGNSGSNRFNVRGNIDVDINEAITSFINATAIFYTGKGVNTNYWESATNLRPHRLSPLVPISMIEANDEASMVYVNNSNNIINGRYLLGGTQLDQTNPFADIYAGGSNTYNTRQFQFDAGINADLGSVLDGLTFSTVFAVDYSSTYSIAYNHDYATFEPLWNTYSGEDRISSLTRYGNDATTGQQNVSGSWYNQTLSFSSQFNYNRSFDDTHNVSAMLIGAGFQRGESGLYHRTSNANMGLHLGYNYLRRYYAEFNGAVIHSARLPENNRTAFSPTVSLGWRISEEGFMDGVTAVDNLRLTASAGIIHTDLDIYDYYLYQGYYTHEDAAWTGWRDGAATQIYDRRRGDNPDMEFPKREEINVGLEASFLNRKINFNSSFFLNRITGNILQAGVLFPSYFTTGWPEYSDIPYTNYNEDKRIGFDFYLDYNERVGAVDLTLGVSGTYFDTEALKRAEMFEDDYQFRTGHPVDGIWGLQSDGFFTEDDIANAPRHTFGEVQPGDIKYIDQNGDGVIDSRDEVFLGKAGWFGSPFTMGVNLTASWENFTLFALGTGRFGAYGMKNNSYYWVSGEGKYSEVVRGRWTEETQDTATYPRLTTGSGDNNFRNSDFWMYSTDRFDIAKVQLTYRLPEQLINRTFVSDMSFYVSGFNLLTIAPEREVLELNVGQAPQTRFFNLGVKAVF